MLGLFLLLCCQPCECAQHTAERVKTAQVPAVCSCVSSDATRKPVHSYIDQPSGRCTYLTDWMYPIALYGYGICNHPSINIARVNQRGCFWGNSTRGGEGAGAPWKDGGQQGAVPALLAHGSDARCFAESSQDSLYLRKE